MKTERTFKSAQQQLLQQRHLAMRARRKLTSEPQTIERQQQPPKTNDIARPSATSDCNSRKSSLASGSMAGSGETGDQSTISNRQHNATQSAVDHNRGRALGTVESNDRTARVRSISMSSTSSSSSSSSSASNGEPSSSGGPSTTASKTRTTAAKSSSAQRDAFRRISRRSIEEREEAIGERGSKTSKQHNRGVERHSRRAAALKSVKPERSTSDEEAASSSESSATSPPPLPARLSRQESLSVDVQFDDESQQSSKSSSSLPPPPVLAPHAFESDDRRRSDTRLTTKLRKTSVARKLSTAAAIEDAAVDAETTRTSITDDNSHSQPASTSEFGADDDDEPHRTPRDDNSRDADIGLRSGGKPSARDKLRTAERRSDITLRVKTEATSSADEQRRRDGSARPADREAARRRDDAKATAAKEKERSRPRDMAADADLYETSSDSKVSDQSTQLADCTSPITVVVTQLLFLLVLNPHLAAAQT